MSNGLIAELVGTREVIVGILCGAAGIVAIWLTGGLRRSAVLGPERSRLDVNLASSIWAIGFMGLGLWMFVPAFYVQLTHRASAATTQPTTQSATARPIGQSATRSSIQPSTSPDIDPTPAPDGLPPRELIVLGAVGQIVGLIGLIVGDRVMLGARAKHLGTSANELPRGVMFGLLGACAAVPLTFAASIFANWISNRVGAPVESHKYIQIFRANRDTNLPAMIAFSAIIVAPIFEEFCFRAHLQTALLLTVRSMNPVSAATEPAWPRWTAIVIAAAIFAAIHLSWWMFFPLFLLAVCCGYAYERTGNIWAPITMHATFNALSLLLAAQGA